MRSHIFTTSRNTKALAHSLLQNARILCLLLVSPMVTSAQTPFSQLNSSSSCGTLPRNLQSKCLDHKGKGSPFEFGVLENSNDCKNLKEDRDKIECEDSVKATGYYYVSSAAIQNTGETFRESSELKRLRLLGWQSGIPLDTCQAIRVSEEVSRKYSSKLSEYCQEKEVQLSAKQGKAIKAVVLVTSATTAIFIIYLWIQFINGLGNLQ